MKHPSEADLALFAGGEASGLSRFFLNRHVRDCRACMDQVNRFELLRLELREFHPPALDWNRLAMEMRANIHVGLEAGECVRQASVGRGGWNPKLAVALASLLMLIGAGFLLKSPAPRVPQEAAKEAAAVLESTGSGLELRHGGSSLTLLNHDGVAADQTVSAQGEIRARYVDGGAVTINNVYLE
jgi:hypothetical protein